MIEKFIAELLSNTIFATSELSDFYLSLVNAYLRGEKIEVTRLEPLKMAAYDRMGNVVPDFNQQQKKDDVVAIIPIEGLMTRSGGWFNYGADDYVNMLEEAYQTESVKSIILDINCNGSTTDAMVLLGDALKKRNKKVISAVRLSAFSGGYYTACHTDKIFPVHKMALVGSIGVMAQFYDDKEAMKQAGYKKIEVNAPESPWKNKDINEAKNGKPQLFQQEVLSPWAQHFIEVVRANRPKLDQSVEGILQGRTFFAYDAVNNGLTDQIMPFDEIIQYALNFDRNEQINSMFK